MTNEFEKHPALAAYVEQLGNMIARGWSLAEWNKFCEALNQALKASSDLERERCAGIVSAARFGEVDQDFRAIHHMIEGGLTVDQIKS